MCQASSNETQREGSMQQYVSNRRPLVSQCNQIVLQMDSSWRSESTLKYTHTHTNTDMEKHGHTVAQIPVNKLCIVGLLIRL